LQTLGHAALPDRRHARLRATPAPARRAVRRRRLLRLPRPPRRRDPAGGAPARRDAAGGPQRGGARRAVTAVQDETGPADPLRVDDRLRRRLPGVALPAHQASRAHHRQQAGHRRLARRRVPQEIPLPPRLRRPVGHPAQAMIYDISPLLSPRRGVWPGDPSLTREVLADMRRGDTLPLSTLRATAPLGSHADAPSHYGTVAPAIHELPLDLYLGPCQVTRVEVGRN